MSSDLHASVVDYVKSSRVPMSIFEIAADLAKLGEHGAEWPRASAQIWKRNLEKAIEEGFLRLDDHHFVRLPLAKPKEKQLSLF